MAHTIIPKKSSVVCVARTLDLILIRHGTVVHRDVVDRPQDVFIGEGTDFVTTHPSIPRMFRLFEASVVDFTTLYVTRDMEGRLIEDHGSFSIRDTSRRQLVLHSCVTTFAIDLASVRSARITCGDDLILFSMTADRVVISPKQTDPVQVNLPFRKTDPVLGPLIRLPRIVQEKMLRVVQTEHHNVLRENYYPSPGPVTIGPREEFRVRSSDIPIRFTLFHHTNGTYYLHFLDSWSGQILVDQRTGARTLNELRRSVAEHVAVGIYRLRLTPASMGKITIGNTAFMFNFAIPPSESPT